MPKHSLISPVQSKSKRKTPSTPNVSLSQTNGGNAGNNGGILPISINEYELVSSQTWAQIGSCSLALELYKMAIKAFDNSLRHLPDNIDSIVGLSRALKLEQDGDNVNIGFKQSTELITSAIQQFPNLNNDFKLWKELSESHLGLKEYEPAHQAITRALNLNPNDSELLYLNAEILMKSKNFNYVKHILHTILSIYQNKSQDTMKELDYEIIRNTHAKLAQLFILESNFKYALSEYKLAISSPLPSSRSKYEEYASIWINYALLKERLNLYDEAYQLINEALNLFGHIPRLLISNAYFLLLPNTKFFEPSVAIQLLESAINQQRRQEDDDQTDFLTWYLLGRAYSLIDSPRQAYDTFQISLGKGPSSPLPWLAVGSLYLKLGQLPDALAAYSQAARLQVEGPDATASQIIASATAWDGLACVYERCDDQAHDAADACLRAASCFRAAGDLRASSQAEQRAHSLTAASRGEAPPPALKGPPDTPVVLLRDLIALSSKEINESCQSPQAQAQAQQAQSQPSAPQQQSRQASNVQPIAQLQPPPQQLQNQTVQAQQQQQQQAQVHAQQQQQQQVQSQQQQQFQQPIRSVQTTPRIETPKQFHHLPLPRQSLAGRSNTPDISEAAQAGSTSHHNTPQQQHQQNPAYQQQAARTPIIQQNQQPQVPQHQSQPIQPGQEGPTTTNGGYMIDVNHRNIYNGAGIPQPTIIAGPPPPQLSHGMPMGSSGPTPTATVAIPGPPGVLTNGNGNYPPPPPPPGYAYAVSGQAPNGFVQWR